MLLQRKKGFNTFKLAYRAKLQKNSPLKFTFCNSNSTQSRVLILEQLAVFLNRNE